MLSYFILKCESWDVDAFIRDAAAFNKNGVIVVFDYGGCLTVVQCPDSIRLKKEYRYYRSGTWTASPWIKWSLFALQTSRIIYTCLLSTKVDRLIFEGADVTLWFTYPLIWSGRAKKVYNLISDWSLPERTDDLYDRLNKFKIWLNDIFMNRSSVQVIAVNRRCFEKRISYWGDKAKQNSTLIEHYWARLLEKKGDYADAPLKICFLGNLRKNFGIEELFDALPELNREYGFTLKVIGPETKFYEHYKDLSQQMGISHLVDWRGFVPLSTFREELRDCFCGINTQMLSENTGANSIAGRVVNFWQYMLVPVVTSPSGSVVQYIERHKIGVVCAPTKDEIQKAIIKAHRERKTIVSNIESFLAKNPYQANFESVFL